MSLGEAFVEVHADLRPFGRDLRKGIRPIVEAYEKELNGAIGRATEGHSEESGRRIGEKMSRGMKNSLTHQFRNKNVFVAIASALAGALDDGISALPTEVKAAIVAGIVLVSPFVISALGAVVTAGLGAGVAAFGVLIGAQFQSVQDASGELFRKIRTDLVTLARPMEGAILIALDIIEKRFQAMGDRFAKIFEVSSRFIAPLTEGTLDAVENLVDAIANSLEDMEPFVLELAKGFGTLGEAIGRAIRILASTGQDGVTALRDLITLVTTLILYAAGLVAIFTKVVGAIRRFAQTIDPITRALSGFLTLVALLADASDRLAGKTVPVIHTNAELEEKLRGLIVVTDGETRALKKYKDAISDASDAARDHLSLLLDWEESLDRVAEALKRNGKSLDVSTDKGRENIKSFLAAIEIAEKRNLNRVQRGELTADQAAAQFQREIGQLREMARQAGIADSTFNNLFSDIIETSALRISSQEIGINDLTGELDSAATMAQLLLEKLQLIRHISGTVARGGVAGATRRGFAEGGILHFPETVDVAESGPEVIVPLTKPARAAALLQESGLMSMFSSGPSQVLVFVGNEQLDSRMVRIVERSNNAQALALNHGGRN